jgi:hypothetical protein
VADSLEAQQERMRRAGEALNEGGSALCRRLTITVAVLLLLSGRAFADWGYEEIEYTMAILNATYPGLQPSSIFFIINCSKIVIFTENEKVARF